MFSNDRLRIQRKSFFIRDILQHPHDQDNESQDSPGTRYEYGVNDNLNANSPTFYYNNLSSAQWPSLALAAVAAAAAATCISCDTIGSYQRNSEQVANRTASKGEETDALDKKISTTSHEKSSGQSLKSSHSTNKSLASPLACLGNRKIRRNRTVFTELQLMGLERRFDTQKYLSTPDRAELARILGLTQLQVKTWYQNRRMKWKKQVMQGGCPIPPTKPKGRPKKNSIPSLGIDYHNGILATNGLFSINAPLDGLHSLA